MAARKPFPTKPGKRTGPVEKVFDDIWWAWGTVQFLPGAVFPRNMTLVREGEELVVLHPVMMPTVQQKHIDSIGPIRHVVRLGDFHGMDNAHYVASYGATHWSPKDATPLGELKVDRELAPGAPTPFADGTLYAFEVAKVPEMVIHLKRHGGILLTCDSVQNWETRPAGASFIGQVMSRMMGFRGRACIGPGWRKESEPKEGDGFGPRFRELLDLDFKHILSAHGRPILETAKDDLRAAVDRAYPKR